MAKKVVGREMTSRVGLDSAEAVKSLKQLTAEVRANTSGWKAQETALKSAGEYQKAAAARVDGLAKSMEAQKAKIDELKSRQSGLNRDTKTGEEQYLKLADQINKASRSYDSMGGQLDRAKSKLQYYNSGLSDLQKGYRQTTSLSESYVKRLEAEGRSAEANKAKLSGLKQAYSNMEAQYKAQTNELERIKTASGAASDAYKRQQVRVNETATSMAKLKNETNALNSSPIKRLSRSFSGLKKEGEETHSVFKQVFSGAFWGTATYGAASSALNLIKAGLGGMIKAGNEFNKEQQVMNATWTTLTGSASKGKGFVKSINDMSNAFGQSNDLVNELDQQFYHVLNKKGPTEELTKSVLTMADTLNMSADDTKRLGLNFTHMMSSSKMQLGDFNMISDQLPMFGERLLDYERKMQHNNALSMSELRKQMSAGKISAKDAEAVMNGLGQKYKKASENMMKTAAGAERAIKSRFKGLAGKLAEPFTKMQSPIFAAVSKWVSDKRTEKEFSKVGKAASKGFKTITEALAKALDIKDGPKTMNNFMDGLAKSVKSVSNVIAKHAKQIVGFFKGLWSGIKIIGSIGAGFFKGLISGLSAVVKPLAKMVGHSKKVKGLSGSLGELSKHKQGLETLGKILAGVFITSKVLKFASAVKTVATDFNLLKGASTVMNLISFGKWSKIVEGVKDFTEATKGASIAQKAFLAVETIADALNPFGWIVLGVTAVAAIGAGFYEAYKHIKPFRNAVNGVGKAIASFTKSALKDTKKFFSDFGKSWNKFWGGIGSGVGKAWKGTSKQVSSGVSSIKKAFSEKIGDISDWFGDVGKSISKWWKGFSKAFKKGYDSFAKTAKGFFKGLGKGLIYALAFPIGLAVIIFGPIVKAIGQGIKLLIKPIKAMGRMISKAFSAMWKPIAKFAQKAFTLIKNVVRTGLNNLVGNFKAYGATLYRVWKAAWNPISKFLSKTINFMVKLWKKFTNILSRVWNSFSKAFKKDWNKVWNTIGDFFSNIFNKISKKFKSWTTAISKTWTGFKNWFGKKWKDMWNGVHDFFSRTTKRISKTFSGWISVTMDALGSFGNKFKSGWNGIVKGVKDIFSGLWKDLKGFARDGMNDVIDIINTGIDAIDSVIHTFGGKRKTIGDLSHVHFATGTGMFGGSRNPITRPTMAMLNDGNDSPQTGNKEMVMLPNGDSGIVQGRNTKMMLPAGTEVLSASETAMLMSMQGVTKYAKGTGFFGDILNSVTNGISGVASWVGKKVGSLEKFFKTATNIIAHPIKSLENLFSWSSKGISGVMSNIGHGLFNGVEKQAKTWWSTLWSMVDLNGGGSYGGGWQSPGSGWTHTDGFGSPRGGGVHDGNDFSASVGTPFHAMHGGTVIRVGGAPAGWGPVGYNIVTKDSTGKEIIYQEFGNAKDVRVHQGQHVKTGDTLGVLGRSGLGTGPHLHVGLTNGGSVWGRNGMSTAGWLDITKQHGKDKGSDAESDTNSSLQKMIKSQVGGGFWKFISKLADMFGDDGGSGTGDPGGAGVQRWKSDVKSALSELGLSTSESMVSRVLRQINTESGGNPKAMGGTDGLADGHAEGLMQVKPGTFSAYHLSGHNNIWNGYDNMLAGLNYAKHRYGSGLSFLGNGHGYENGGIIGRHGLYEIAEHNKPEMVLPLTNKSRANQLISRASQIVNGNNDSQVVSINSESNKKLDKVIALLEALVSGQGNVQAVIAKSDVVNAVKSDNKIASQYSQMMGY